MKVTVARGQSGKTSETQERPMRIILFAMLALAMTAFTPAAEAAKSDAKGTSNAAACKSIRSDMHHKGGAYIPAGVKCGKKRRAA